MRLSMRNIYQGYTVTVRTTCQWGLVVSYRCGETLYAFPQGPHLHLLPPLSHSDRMTVLKHAETLAGQLGWVAATNMGDGIAEDRNNHHGGSNSLCADRMDKCQSDLESRSPVQSTTDTPGTSASTPTSSSEDGHDKLLGVDPDYCRRILVRDAKGTIREIVLPKGLDLDRPKRTRTSFTAEQLYQLELQFQRCQYVVGRERTELARQLNLSETQETLWLSPDPSRWLPAPA
ncbi:hypothetical protein DPEC_G00099540 [Dallia pectoralis]|uniref:Uncharacterized protein n=1 Tax=Dallia pectoralis TaxID=75939 RepID=A0ACC2GWH1_DALPE|nr:hypothetical protein DPEC_G00099540 [Dallia pectoralis]